MRSVFRRCSDSSTDCLMCARGQPAVGRHHAALGGDQDLVALGRILLQPGADDRLRLAALVARHPARIDVGGVDEGEAGIDEGVEQLVRGRLVGRPAEHVAAEGDGGEFEARFAELALFHGVTPVAAVYCSGDTGRRARARSADCRTPHGIGRPGRTGCRAWGGSRTCAGSPCAGPCWGSWACAMNLKRTISEAVLDVDHALHLERLQQDRLERAAPPSCRGRSSSPSCAAARRRCRARRRG